MGKLGGSTVPLCAGEDRSQTEAGTVSPGRKVPVIAKAYVTGETVRCDNIKEIGVAGKDREPDPAILFRQAGTCGDRIVQIITQNAAKIYIRDIIVFRDGDFPGGPDLVFLSQLPVVVQCGIY